MAKIKVTAEVVNRGGKRYIAKDGYIEVTDSDLQYFDGFAKQETKKKNESNKKRN